MEKNLNLPHLKSTTPAIGLNTQNSSGLYVPIDPKYMYYNVANSRYTWNNPIYDANTQPADYGLDQLMFHRQDLIFSKIDMLYCEISERRKIKEANMYRINLDQCCFKNMIYARGDHFWDRNRLELERRIIDLERDKRHELSNYFKDITFIRKELRESLIEKKEEEQKANLLMNQQEESI